MLESTISSPLEIEELSLALSLGFGSHAVKHEKQITIVYAQQMLNPQHDCTHNKIKNFVNMIIE